MGSHKGNHESPVQNAMAKFIATISKSKLNYLDFGSDYNQARFVEFCKDNDGKQIRLETVKKTVSDEMRGYYYGAVIPTVKATVPEWSSLKPDDVHEILKKVFNSFRFFNPITKKTEVVGRTAMSQESNTARAMEFIEKITEWMATEYFVEMPTPQEYKKLRDSAQTI